MAAASVNTAGIANSTKAPAAPSPPPFAYNCPDPNDICTCPNANCGSSSSNRNLAIGLGVGLGVGIPLIAVIVVISYLAIKRRRQRQLVQPVSSPIYESVEGGGGQARLEAGTAERISAYVSARMGPQLQQRQPMEPGWNVVPPVQR